MRDRILCIEDDPTMQALVEVSLPDFDVVKVATLAAAKRELDAGGFSAVLVDIELPDGDGLRFLGNLLPEAGFRELPVLVLSDHAEISNKVMAFSLGADDFIAKPFDPIELRARVTAKVRKRNSESDAKLVRKVGDIVLDLGRQKALHIQSDTGRPREIDLGLTAIELKIVVLLTRRLEQVFSREQILGEVWKDTHISDRTVDSHVAHLRQKLSSTEVVIDTVKNAGYRAVLNKT